MPDVNGVPKVERQRELLHVLDIGVHLVPGVCLARAAMPAAIVSNHAIALTQKEHQLVVPVVSAQRPAVVEHDRLRFLGTPVLVEDVGTVLGRDEWHWGCLPLWVCRPAGPAPVSMSRNGGLLLVRQTPGIARDD